MKKEEPQIFCEDDKDFIFRFQLEPVQEIEGDPLTELIKTQLRALLDTVVLCSNGEPLEVEEFKYIHSKEIYPIYDYP